MNKIDLLLYSTAALLALAVHVAVWEGVVADPPLSRHAATIRVGPVTAVREIVPARIAVRPGSVGNG